LERIAEVNDAIQLGLEQAERGEMISAEALKADLDQLFASFEGQSGAI
jgi:predicted transcriptional regulator